MLDWNASVAARPGSRSSSLATPSRRGWARRCSDPACPAGRVLTVTIGTGLGACLTADGRVIEMVGELEIEKLARRPTVDGRADDVLSARGLADRLGVDTAELRSLVDDPAVAAAIGDHGRRLGAFLAPVVDELDVDLVVVGGGLVNAFDLFGPALRIGARDDSMRTSDPRRQPARSSAPPCSRSPIASPPSR